MFVEEIRDTLMKCIAEADVLMKNYKSESIRGQDKDNWKDGDTSR